MRPAGQISLAIMRAAEDLAGTVDGCPRGPTLRELAAKANVGSTAALYAVKTLAKSGALRPIARRKVPYRNKPVAEYAPAPKERPEDDDHIAVVDIFAIWARG